MVTWGWMVVIAFVLAIAGAIYIRLRWRRSPQAYRAMMGLAACYFLAGVLAAVWAFHLAAPRPVEVASTSPTAPIPPIPLGGASMPASAAYLPNHYTGKVVSITDGDTIDVALAPKGLIQAIRLYGIDAPEHDQAFGPESTEHLAKLLSGKTVTLDCENDRSYGRLICKVLLPDGEDVDLDQVKVGMAWDYRQYQDEQTPTDRATYSKAECTAMKAKIGLWSQPNPIQPQDFRHGTHSPLLLDANGCRISSEPTSGPVIGNARSHIFEWPGCPYYSAISPDHRVPFPSPQAAEQAGYRPAHNCP
jgi:micrococcal nuclease